MIGDGRVYAWGDGSRGQLGLGEGKDAAHTPAVIAYVSCLSVMHCIFVLCRSQSSDTFLLPRSYRGLEGKGVCAVASGSAHNIALTGSLLCCFLFFSLPRRIADRHSIAEAGYVFEWGRGRGTHHEDVRRPQLVHVESKRVAKIAAAAQWSCAITGSLQWCVVLWLTVYPYHFVCVCVCMCVRACL